MLPELSQSLHNALSQPGVVPIAFVSLFIFLVVFFMSPGNEVDQTRKYPGQVSEFLSQVSQRAEQLNQGVQPQDTPAESPGARSVSAGRRARAAAK